MNWRLIIAISSVAALVTCSISLFRSINWNENRPYGTCWLPHFESQTSNNKSQPTLLTNLACPFKLQFVGFFHLSLFIAGYIVIALLYCFVPPHIMFHFEKKKWVHVVAYLFIVLAFSISLACMLSAVGLVVYYSTSSNFDDLITFYTSDILKSCTKLGGQSCISFVFLSLSTVCTAVASVLVMVEIIHILRLPNRAGYSPL